MSQALIELGLFTGKAMILSGFIIAVFAAIVAIAAKTKEKIDGHIKLTNLNESLDETSQGLLEEILPKKQLKQYLKDKKKEHKSKNKSDKRQPATYVIDFNGDIKASAVRSLRQEINAILNIATPKDEVVIRLESPGGSVTGYGLAASQLTRIRDKKIPLTVTIDQVAASGGYMMACVADKILSAPFAIVGSIGVIVQLPNFNRYLREKNIDFEQLTAGEFKRTLTMFGENTDEGREKLKKEIEVIHKDFKNLISTYRSQLDVDKIATGEHWLGQQALDLNLVDELKTSDDYLMEKAKKSNVFEISYVTKKPLLARLTSSASQLYHSLFSNSIRI